MGSEPRDVIAAACATFEGDRNERGADIILSSLEAKGFTVARLEQVGWRTKKPAYVNPASKTDVSYGYQEYDPKSKRWEFVYRIAPPTKEGE